MVSAAPVTEETLRFFAAFDMSIYDLLGQSEGTAPICTCSPVQQRWKIGTVGLPLPGVEVRIDPQNSEIMYRGRNVMMGYLKNPNETLRTLDPDGWLHTGDQGKKDEDGFLKVTGRLKELIVTAGGENIPPILIESELKRLAPALSNVVLIGDKRKYLTVLLTLNCRVNGDTEGAEGELLGEAAALMKTLGSNARTAQEASEDSRVQKYFYDVIQQYNATAFSNAQK